MPLHTASDATAFTDPGTLSIVFRMNDEKMKSIRVTIQTAALLKFRGGANPLSVFALNRSKIEGIASRKFDQQGGSVIVVREDDVPDEFSGS